MKIPQPFLQFQEKRTLLIVAGRQTADLYLAHKGSLKKLRSIKIPNPLYSDREGFMTTSSKGARLGSGSVYEGKEYSTQKDFTNKLESAVEDALGGRGGARSIYLFAPPAHAANIEAALTTKARKLLERTYPGNYVKLDPLEALRKVHKQDLARAKSSKRALAPRKAKKILDKSRKARRVVGE